MVSFLILLRSLRVYIIKQYYSPQAQLILLNNPLDFISGFFNDINFTFGE